jgi:excisionase family DNA binding protein
VSIDKDELTAEVVSADYSTREAAERLGMAVRSVQAMVDRGELEAWKTPGGHRRISAASVQRWLASRRVGAAEPPPAAARSAGGPRVLLIEDSKHFQNLIGLLLRHQFPQLTLDVADDGITGLAMTGRLQPDLLMVDILLPGIDGAMLISTLRGHPQFANMRLLVVTSLDEAELEHYRFALDGVPVVHKSRLAIELPPRLRELLAIGAAP